MHNLQLIKDNQINRKNLPDVLKRMGVRTLCEVGVAQGKNFTHLLNCNPDLAVAVDLWREDGILAHNDYLRSQETLDAFYQSIVNLKQSHPCVQVIRDYSVAAANNFANQLFDFVYIDADHTYEGCAKDIVAWYPKVKIGGILSGHDYKNKPSHGGIKFGVVQAVTEFIKQYGLEAYISQERCPSWFVEKI